MAFNFTAGLTSAMDSEQNRAYQRALMLEAAQRQTRLAAEESRIADEHRRQQERYEQDKKVGLSAIKTLAQMQQLSAPPAGPQSPPPGQPSVPMMMPPAGPMGPPSGMEGAAPMGTPDELGGMPPPPPPAAVSPSWSPSAAAPEELGGPPPPIAGAPAAPATPQIGAPPGGPQLPSKLPPQWLSVPNAITAMDKAGVPAEQQYQTLQKLFPIIQAQNKEAIQDLQLQIKVAHAMEEAKRTVIQEFRATNPRPTALQRNAEFAAGGAPGSDIAGKVLERQGTLTKSQRPAAPGAAGAGGASAAPEALTPEGMKVAIELSKAGQPLPGGWSKTGIARGNAILNAMALEQEGGAGSGSIAAGRATYKAGAASEGQLTKRSDALEQSSKKIDKDIVTMMSVLDKGNFGSVTAINTPINKLRTMMSDPDLGKLELAAKIVGTEYERMINGGLLSIAQLHEGAREDAQRILNGNMSVKEIRAKVPLMRQEIDNQRNAFAEQLTEVRARNRSGATAPAARSTTAPAPTNARGWKLMTDKSGNQAYVSPDGKQYDEVK